jgi:hypothetical protein
MTPVDLGYTISYEECGLGDGVVVSGEITYDFFLDEMIDAEIGIGECVITLTDDLVATPACDDLF